MPTGWTSACRRSTAPASWTPSTPASPRWPSAWRRAFPILPAKRRSAAWKAGSKTFQAGWNASAAQVAGIDPALIRSLEAQVAGLSAHLSKPGTPLPEFEDISPRLNEIEKSLAGTRDSILGAAREAAESAVRSLADSSANTAAVSGLAQDLKTLETLTRRSDERNSRTFEAIHDTLLKIVDRLGSLETSEPVEAVSELLDTPAEPARRAPHCARRPRLRCRTRRRWISTSRCR